MNTRILYCLLMIACCFAAGNLQARQIIAQRNVQEEPDVEATSVIQPNESAEEKIKRNLFLKVEVTKTSCFVGEPLKVTYKLYSRLNTSSQVMRRPSFTGFSVLEMVDSYDSKPQVEKINGLPYYMNLIRKVQLFPLQEGRFMLDAAEVESIVKFVKINIGAEPTFFKQKVSLLSEPVTIHVNPLPLKGQPESYSGAVGAYTVKVKGPDTAIHQGELVKVRVVVEGTGNISLLTPPEVKWPEGVDTADPAVREVMDKFVFPLSGMKIFEYSFAAPDTGTVTVPPARLSYFDPRIKMYKDAVSEPLVLHVASGESKEKQQLRANAINNRGGGNIPLHYFWFGGVVLLILVWLAYQFFQAGKKQKQEEAVRPVVAAVKIPSADEQLVAAREALQTGNMKLFYHEIQQVMWNMAGLRSEVPPSLLNKQNVAIKLSLQGVDDTTIAQLLQLLNTCEWALYVPGHEQGDPRVLLDEARQVLSRLQPVV